MIEFLKSRVGTITTCYAMLWAAIIWFGGIDGFAAMIDHSLTALFEKPATGYGQAVVWIAIIFGGIQTAIQLAVGKENFDYG